MKRAALSMALTVEEYDADGNMVQASQPQQLQMAALSADAMRRALAQLAEMLASQVWPGEGVADGR